MFQPACFQGLGTLKPAFAALLTASVPVPIPKLHQNAGSRVWKRRKPKKMQVINFCLGG
jgi:hypothetical protein